MSGWAALVAAALLAAAAPAHAASAVAASSATIFKPMAIVTNAQMSFGKLLYTANSGPAVSTVVLSAQPPVARTSADVQLLLNGGETPAIRTITGEANRTYRVTVTPTTTSLDGLRVDNFVVWSANSGNITTRSGLLSASGADTIRVGATLYVPRGTKNGTYTAQPTINITYD